MHDIIKTNSLRFNEMPHVDSKEDSRGLKGKYPDLVLTNKKDTEGLYLIEFKPPSWTPYEPELVEDAFLKASRQGIKFFGTCNFKKLVIWRQDLVDVPLMDRHFTEYDLVDIRSLKDIRASSIQNKFKEKLISVLKELEQIHFGRIIPKKKAIDEFFIELLRTAIESFYFSISEEIQVEHKKNAKFKRLLEEWFFEHGWNFENKLENYEKVAKQYLLLIINKVLFYNALKLHHKELKDLKLRVVEEDSRKFKDELNKYFEDVLDIDYESIYSSNFIENIPVPNELVPRLVSFVNSLSDKYDFSKVNYDIMGRIFENLIPSEERHMLGQFFTSSNIVDLINAFCIKSADDNVLDPGCGAGTFLVRAYNLKKILDPKQKHEDIIQELYGFDISKFAAHLTNINLSIKDLKAKESYPRIINDDFFNIMPNHTFKEHYKARDLSGALVDVKIPLADAVVGNPPYTRQEELEKVFGKGYKEKINDVLKHDFEVQLSGMASIYAHFFIHGAKFLKESGRFGFITSNSWLDVEYGGTLQKFFLNNFKIIAVIESKIERFFEYADVNTCITILERCSNKEKRDKNLIKFVQLKKSISDIFPEVVISNDQEITLRREKRRYKKIKQFIKNIENNKEFYEDSIIKIYVKKQKELYSDNKWGKFIYGTKVLFKIIGKEEEFTKLYSLAFIDRGVLTGDNKFFYFDEKKAKLYKINKKYLTPLLKSPKESKKILFSKDNLKFKVLVINDKKSEIKDGGILSYLNHGERIGVNKKPTCKAREIWYKLDKINYSPILMPEGGINERYIAFLNRDKEILADKRLMRIIPKNQDDVIPLCSWFNSTLFALFCESLGRHNLGLGALDFRVYELKHEFPIINISELSVKQRKKLSSALNKISKREIKSIFKETEMKDKQELDKVFFDILKLSADERKQIYNDVVDLVKNRLEKAHSVDSKKGNSNISEKAIIENVINEIDHKKLKRFPEDFLPKNILKHKLELPKAENVEISSTLTRGFHVKADNQIIKCKSQGDANYIRYAIMNGKSQILIPSEEKEVNKIVKEYSKVLKSLKKSIEESLLNYVHDEKTVNKLSPVILDKILKI